MAELDVPLHGESLHIRARVARADTGAPLRKIPQNRVSIVAGSSGRSKLVALGRLNEAELLQKVPR